MDSTPVNDSGRLDAEGRLVESHPFPPFIPEGARLLMCGTFPPKPNRWSMDFYYPNFINDMWRIFGFICFGDRDALVDVPHKTFRLPEIERLLTELGIALSDTGREVVRLRDNASDKFLEIVENVDLVALLARMPQCVAVATTGEKAAGVVAELTGTSVPKVGEYMECELKVGESVRHFRHWRMPSTSRAYPLKLEKKAAIYGRLLASVVKNRILLHGVQQ